MAGRSDPRFIVRFRLVLFPQLSRLARQRQRALYFICQKCSLSEADWWSQVFSFAEDYADLPRGTIKATVLIETLPAVFQMDEILYHLRDHIVGLNCGRWDYIFSYIKTLKNHSDRVLPDRQSVTMTQPFLSAYSRLLIKTCHRRVPCNGRYGGIIPSKDVQRMNWCSIKSEPIKSLRRKTA